MESKFTVRYSADKKLYREFGNVHTTRNKAWIMLLICISVLMALSVYHVVRYGSVRPYYLGSAIVFYFFWLFFDLFTGATSYNAVKKAARGEQVQLTFSEVELTSQTASAESKVAYPSFLDVYESDNLFALYTSQMSAILVPKSGFTEGTVDEFRTFITQKIPKFRRVSSPTRKRIIAIALGVCFAVAMVGGFFLYKYRNDRPVKFESAPYSISLPAAFEEVEEEGYPFVAKTKDVYVSMACDTKQELKDNGLIGVDTLADYAELFVSVFDIDVSEQRVLDNGTVCYTYKMDYENDATYYYCDALTESDDAFWVTEFYCFASAEEKYAPLFYEWAGTIQIED